MSRTECTAPAPSSATPIVEKEPARSLRRKVEHLFWVETMEVAAKLNVDMRSLCGVWSSPCDPPRPDELVPIVAGYPVFFSEDCKRCARVYAAAARRVRERGTAR